MLYSSETEERRLYIRNPALLAKHRVESIHGFCSAARLVRVRIIRRIHRQRQNKLATNNTVATNLLPKADKVEAYSLQFNDIDTYCNA